MLLTGAQGDVFDWVRDDAEEYWPQFDGAGQDRTIVNLRWRNCRVTARFRHIVFANCDFRGTRFENCSFEGTVFVNCLLDGAMFGDCDIVGPVVSASAAVYDQEGMPSFAAYRARRVDPGRAEPLPRGGLLRRGLTRSPRASR